ncbi:MAG: hypothetical protein JXA18_16445, partial [Chitinispirillaceae bacterium]|nr:hypothetical protein [Chitinispirillaceae bacterium]
AVRLKAVNTCTAWDNAKTKDRTKIEQLDDIYDSPSETDHGQNNDRQLWWDNVDNLVNRAVEHYIDLSGPGYSLWGTDNVFEGFY